MKARVSIRENISLSIFVTALVLLMTALSRLYMGPSLDFLRNPGLEITAGLVFGMFAVATFSFIAEKDIALAISVLLSGIAFFSLLFFDASFIFVGTILALTLFLAHLLPKRTQSASHDDTPE